MVILIEVVFRSDFHKERISCLIRYYDFPPKGFFFIPRQSLPYVKELSKAYSSRGLISSKGLQLKRKQYPSFIFNC